MSVGISPGTWRSALEENRLSERLSWMLENVPPIVDRFLEEVVGTKIRNEAVADIADPAIYSLTAGGKRIRPLILLMAAGVNFPVDDPQESGVFNPDNRAYRVMMAASALESIHTYSLIHDDLPAMDDDDLRRGRPSCHKAFSEWAAILAGDALNTYAFRLLLECADPEDHTVLPSLLSILTRAAGMGGMICGQALDLKTEKNPDHDSSGNPSLLLDEIHKKKTAAMMVAGMEMGAVLGGVEDIKSYGRYGMELGLLFQITDDILDVTSDDKTLGKTAGKDEKSGKLTYPALYGLEESMKRASNLSESLREEAALLAPGRRSDMDYRDIFEALPGYIEKRIR